MSTSSCCFSPSSPTGCERESSSKPSFARSFYAEISNELKKYVRVDLAVREVFKNPTKSTVLKLADICVFHALAISSAVVLGAAFGVYIFAMNVLLGAAVKAYLNHKGPVELPNVRDLFSKDNLAWKIVIGVAVWFPMAFLSGQLVNLITWIFGQAGIVFKQGQDVERLLGAGGLTGALWTVFGCVIAPVIEEILFRGYAEKVMEEANNPSFRQRFMTALKVNAIFGAMHMSPFQGWFNIPIFIATFVMGMTFSALKEVTGDLWAPAVCHTLNNTLATIAARI